MGSTGVLDIRASVWVTDAKMHSLAILLLRCLAVFGKQCTFCTKIMELFWLEKALEIIGFNCKPSTAKFTTKTCPYVP